MPKTCFRKKKSDVIIGNTFILSETVGPRRIENNF